MKYFARALLAAALVSTAAQAQIQLNADKDVQILVVDGEEVGSFGHTSNLTLDNGTHQLVVRVERVIHMGGNKNKYKSPVMVVTFNDNDSQVKLNAGMLIANEAISKEFDRNPSIIMSSNNPEFSYQQDVLMVKGFSIMRDYLRELDQFNRTDSPAALAKDEQKLQEVTKLAERLANDDATPKLERLKTFYRSLDLSDEERKAFLTWAISQ